MSDEFNAEDYWENRLKKMFGLHGVGYIGMGRYYNNWLYKIRGIIFIRRMKRMGIDFAGVDVLDIGSGTGFYIERWKELGVKTIVGTDITSIAIEELKRKYLNDVFYQVDIGGDIETINKFRFDIVSAFDVLFHIVDDRRYAKAIHNIYSILKPGGFFVFSDNFLHQETKRGTHQVSRSLNEIEKILNDTSFEIIERIPMFVLMNSPVDSNSTLLKKLWQIISKFASINEVFGFLLGAFLYPLELVLISLVKEGPSTKMIICKKSES